MTKEQALSWLRNDTQWVSKAANTTTQSQRTCGKHEPNKDWHPTYNAPNI